MEISENRYNETIAEINRLSKMIMQIEAAAGKEIAIKTQPYRKKISLLWRSIGKTPPSEIKIYPEDSYQC